jgi:hypothetical protein
LFSQDSVAQFVSNTFEPVWVSVRPVPIIKIDFGDGRVLTRTLHGNILSAVCAADGTLLDALPGIYTAEAYVEKLDQLRLVHQRYQSAPTKDRPAFLRGYHERAAAALAQGQAPERFVEQARIAPVGKGFIEMPAQRLLAGPGANQFAQPGFPGGNFNVPHGVVAKQPPPQPVPLTPEELKGWKALVEDTQLNEKTRRRQIHEMLVKAGPVGPDKVLKPIYKDVLVADLDDPYLGLGKVLFDNYPFATEDAKP